jgi:hypothetical protein
MYPQRPPEFPTIPGVPQNQMQGGTQISQQYTPGGTQTNTRGGSYGVAQTPDLSKYFNAMLKYKMAMEAQQRQGAMPQQRPVSSGQGQMSQESSKESELRNLQIEAQKHALMKSMEPEAKPADFGRWMMNQTGNWGTQVDPSLIPASLQGTIMGGMYGQGTNWDTSNPNIMGPRQFAIGQYTKSASGAGSSQPRAGIGRGGSTSSEEVEARRRAEEKLGHPLQSNTGSDTGNE